VVMEAAALSNVPAARRCMQTLVPELKLVLQSVQAGWQSKPAEQQTFLVGWARLDTNARCTLQ
jgi:hypothetical protein